MKKAIALMLCCLLFAAILAGCNSGSQASSAASESGSSSAAEGSSSSEESAAPSGEKLKMEFFQQQGEESIQAGYIEMCKGFNEANPEYEIEMNTVPEAPATLTSRFAANDIPPIFNDYPTQLQFHEKVENGFILDLTGQEFLNNVDESAIEMCRQPDGKDYALPYLRNFMGVYYNIDLFEQYDVEIPTTYKDFIAACETFKSNGVTPLQFAFKDNVNHFFQATNIAFMPDGVDKLVDAAANGTKIEGDAEYKAYAERLLEIVSYGGDDAFAVPNTTATEQFANGSSAMFLAGSYIRGNLALANPDFNFGVFPLPNDTVETTTTISGINASHCISASATPEEQEAGLKFLAYLADPENAQNWSNISGEISTIKGVTFSDDRLAPQLDFINTGKVHDWMGGSLNNNIVTGLYNVTQAFLLDQDVDKYLKDIDSTIATNR